MYLEDGHLSQALNYMEWACDLSPKNIVTRKLKNLIARKLDPFAPEEPIGTEEDSLKGVRLNS